MPFVYCLGESVGNAGAHTDQRGLLDAELGRDLIGGAEADATDVAGQPIRVLRDELLLGPAANDTLRPLRADAGHLAQAARLLLDDVEHGIAEGAYQLLRVDRPDAADHARAEILLDPC